MMMIDRLAEAERLLREQSILMGRLVSFLSVIPNGLPRDIPVKLRENRESIRAFLKPVDG